MNSFAIITVGAIVALSATFTQGAFPNIDCVDNYVPGSDLAGPCGPNGERCDFSNPSNVFVLGCDDDCKANHNARIGRCDNEGTCLCGVSQPVRPEGEKSIQCADISKRDKFDKICDIDCKCSHNAVYGQCQYKTQACQCMGRVRGGTNCPYTNGNEFFLATGGLYHEMGFSVSQFVNGYGK